MRRTVALSVAGLLLTTSLVACSDGEGGITLPTRSPSIALPSPTRSVTGGLPSPTRTGATEDTEEPEPTATQSPEDTDEPEPTATESPEDTDEPEPTVTQTVTQSPEDTDEPEPSRTPTGQPEPSDQPSESSEQPAESPSESEPATEDSATEDNSTDDEATNEASDDNTAPTWLWWLLAAVVVGLAIGIPLLLRSRRRNAWRQQLAEAEGELGWVASELLPGLRRAHSREEVAGGWAVASPRVTAAEDSLTALESNAYDDAGRDRARALRDASRLARQRMEHLLAPGPQDTWALDLDTIMADLEAALGPRTSPSG